MRIVFGWNHFKIRSYTPTDLGLPKPTDTPYSIELQQKYAHLFWIPFFSIGQRWVIRKAGKLYQVPTPIMTHIHQRNLPSAKTPWYTFAGPIIILAATIIYGFSEKVNAVQAENYRKNSFESKGAVLSGKLTNVKIHDYVWLQDYSGATTSNVILKVTRTTPDSLTVTTLTSGISPYELSPMKMQYLFSMKRDASDTFSVSKKKLMQAIPRTWGVTFKPVDVIGNGIPLTLNEIYHLDGPMLNSRGTGAESDNTISLDFTNIGWPATVTKITNLSGPYTWTSDLPRQVGTAKSEIDDYGGRFVLQGTKKEAETHYKVRLTLVDSLQKEHNFIVEGDHMKRTITPIQ